MTEFVMVPRHLVTELIAMLAIGSDDQIREATTVAVRAAAPAVQQAEPVAWRPKLAHPIPYISGAPRESDLKHWEGNMGVEIEYAYAGHPPAQPEQPAPIPTSERLPTVSDGDPFGMLLAFSLLSDVWQLVNFYEVNHQDYSHWFSYIRLQKPQTGLTRPAAPGGE